MKILIKNYPPIYLQSSLMFFFTVFFLLAPLFIYSQEKSDEPFSSPNVIIILADDLGFGDLGGYFGGSSKTTNLNQMAKEGMIFTDFHSNPSCSPSRASLLTGRYSQRLGIEVPKQHVLDLPKNQDEITIADYLRSVGYYTGIIGKWHLGRPPLGNPLRYGFDEFIGYYGGDLDYFSKVDRYGNKDWWKNESPLEEEGYVTDLITQHAEGFIKRKKDSPFFLLISHLAVHFPWQAPTDDNLWKRRTKTKYTMPSPGTKSKLGPNLPENIPTVLTEMVEELDESVGSILKTLKEEKIERNTLVIFISDNGAYTNYEGNLWPHVGSNNPLRGQKGGVLEGAHRVPAIAWWPTLIPALSATNETIMIFDWLPTIMDLLKIDHKVINDGIYIDGVSILQLMLKNEPVKPRDLFWRVGNKKAVRSNQMKLVIENDSTFLYNLSKDISETVNLANLYPEIVEKLKDKLRIWERNVDN